MDEPAALRAGAEQIFVFVLAHVSHIREVPGYRGIVRCDTSRDDVFVHGVT